MRITLVYFSGTGNTAWVVQCLTATLTLLGADVVAHSCETLTVPVDLKACDMLGLAFPTASSYPPTPFRAWLATLPEAAGLSLFAVTTASYAAGDTAWYAVQPLKARGYAPFLLANVLMPNNFYIPPMDFIPVTPPERVPARLERAQHKIMRLARLIHTQTPHCEGTGLLGRLLGLQQRWSMDTFEKRLFRPFFADETCTRCGWCVRHCPAANITLDEGGVHFAARCCLCMRCYSFCPQQAIQATPKTRQVQKYRRYAGPEGRRYTP